jgi:predicted nucleic acid-binding protein
MIVVCNSTPLIALAKIDQLGLLKEFFGEVFIPEEVYDEVVRRGRGLAGASEVAACAWILNSGPFNNQVRLDGNSNLHLLQNRPLFF